jgi:hypothetical protein
MAKTSKPTEPTDAAQEIDPTVAALATAAGLDPNDLDADDVAELQAAADADAARTGTDPVGSTERQLVREATGNSSDVAISLMLESCEVFGVNPEATANPLELSAWRFYPGSDVPGRVTLDAVVLVTAGGLKLKRFDDGSLDEDTDDRLARRLGCFKVDEKGVVTRLPLPADLTLPAGAANGLVTGSDHQYVGGYVKAGGAAAADERARRREARMTRFGGLRPGQV